MGYGSRAMELLGKYYQGELAGVDSDSDSDSESDSESSGKEDNKSEKKNKKGLLKEKVKPRKKLPPLLVALRDRPAEQLHYMGVAYGPDRSRTRWLAISTTVPPAVGPPRGLAKRSRGLTSSSSR